MNASPRHSASFFAITAIRFGGNNRRTIGILLAMLMPAFLIAIPLGVEAAGWSASTARLQRTANIAASAGLLDYQNSLDGFAATTAALQMAKLNGVVSTNTPTWDAPTQTLTADNITAQMVVPTQDPSNKAIKVTLRNRISATISQTFSSP
jgi:hypothetical protein